MSTRVASPSAAPSGERATGFVAVDLGPGVLAGFTGAVPDVGATGDGGDANLSHRRPHVPARLADARARLASRVDVEVADLHFMRQVHGRDVAVVTRTTPRGAEIRDVDALVTVEPGRALCVQVADCVPILLASSQGPVAAVHAGRRGVELGVLEATLARLDGLGASPGSLRAAIGPAIGGCCYEVPLAMQRALSAAHPAAVATTAWGTSSLDLPAAVEAVLANAGVASVTPSPACTLCGPGAWFSHRGDPDAGRQVGVVVRHEAA